MKRKSRLITNKDDIQYLLNITEKDFTKTFMMETFGEFAGKVRFNPYDLIDIPPGSYGPEGKKNRNTFKTTVGLWVYNKFFIEPNLFDVFHYVNETITKGKYGDLNQTLTYALMEDRIDVEVLKKFITYNEFLMNFVDILAPNDTAEMLKITAFLNPIKEKMAKENKEALENGDIIVATKMENDLINIAMEKLKDDPSLDSYISGARGNIGNHFKNTYVMKGVVRNPITNKFNVALSNYIDGISSDDYSIFANSLAAGPYARSNKTAIGGYWEKLFVSAFGHIRILPKGTDCGTDKYIEFILDNPVRYIYSYIIEDDGSLVLLDSQNMNKYKGKKVKMRFSSMCKAKEGICNKCAGELFYKLGRIDVGLALPAIPSKLKNISMKSFHDSVEKLTDINVEEAFGFSGKTKIR